jgi:rsbT co-antagonist protein RsbR
MEISTDAQDRPRDIPQAEQQRIHSELLQLLADTLREYAIILLDPEGRVISWNSAAEHLIGWKAKEIIGNHFSRFYPPEDVRNGKTEMELEVAARDGRFEDEGWRVRSDGAKFWANVIITALKDAGGNLRGFGKVMRDMTERRAMEEQLRRQANEIMEMATVPIVRVWEGILLVPLIGTLDSQRTQQLMERLLHRITETMSQVALLDITGVPTIDTQTAQHLIETISAVRLLGAEPILTGIRPVIAQTLVHLGIDLANVATRSSLTAGLRLALNTINVTTVAKGSSA